MSCASQSLNEREKFGYLSSETKIRLSANSKKLTRHPPDTKTSGHSELMLDLMQISLIRNYWLLVPHMFLKIKCILSSHNFSLFIQHKWLPLNISDSASSCYLIVNEQ